jgi:hypothetical protein
VTRPDRASADEQQDHAVRLSTEHPFRYSAEFRELVRIGDT